MVEWLVLSGGQSSKTDEMPMVTVMVMVMVMVMRMVSNGGSEPGD